MLCSLELALVIAALIFIGCGAISIGLANGIPDEKKFACSMLGLGIGFVTFGSCLCMSNLFARSAKASSDYSGESPEPNDDDLQETNVDFHEQAVANMSATGRVRSNIYALNRSQSTTRAPERNRTTVRYPSQQRAIKQTQMAFDNFAEVLNSYSPEQYGDNATVPEDEGTYYPTTHPPSRSSMVRTPSRNQSRSSRHYHQEAYQSLAENQRLSPTSSTPQANTSMSSQFSRSYQNAQTPSPINYETSPISSTVPTPQPLLFERVKYQTVVSSKRNSLALFKKYFS